MSGPKRYQQSLAFTGLLLLTACIHVSADSMHLLGARAKASLIHNGIIEWEEVCHYPPDKLAESIARFTFTDNVLPKTEYTEEEIQQWIEGRKKPHSQKSKIKVQFADDFMTIEYKAERGLRYAHGIHFTDYLCDDYFVSHMHDINHYFINDMKNETDTAGPTARFLSAYTHPMLLNNPVSLLTSIEFDEKYTVNQSCKKDGVIILRRGNNPYAAMAATDGEGLIASREVQFVVMFQSAAVHLATEVTWIVQGD